MLIKFIHYYFELQEDIVNLSSVLIDKLTYLISTHPTLTTLGSLLIQIQVNAFIVYIFLTDK